MPNRLLHATSPYLLQHADNPVDWHVWGAEALALARTQDKPILLSIGYSACHWCHVMAHESFEDPATAAIMNQHFINIKVDREERPDLDKIYQAAHHLLAERAGGWPLTMFLSPHDLAPFFGGTYFPKEARYHLPAFGDLLYRIAEVYRTRRSDIQKQNQSLTLHLRTLEIPEATGLAPPDTHPLRQARHYLAQAFDPVDGGLGQAPKFPHTFALDFLLREQALQPDSATLWQVTHSFRKMAWGGLYDHIGGGFYRYSVDAHWTIPHFEKMLYDNGPLLQLACDLWQLTQDEFYAQTAQGVADWVLREMQSPQGGCYSSLDADSAGHEGQFYTWTPAEVRQHLDPETYALLAYLYGLDRRANFEGQWHLHGYHTLAQAGEHFQQPLPGIESRLAQARQTLYTVRCRRVWPGRDDKILTAWNALMLRGLARAARSLHEPRYLASAQQALAYVQRTLWRDGRLLATAKGETAALMAYLDDYAFLLEAVLELLQTRWDSTTLDFAILLAEALLTHFWDSAQGGFYFTAHDHETLLVRPKPLLDESLPAGNAVAARSLLLLGYLLGETRYLAAAEQVLSFAAPAITAHPAQHCSLLIALRDYHTPPELVILRSHDATTLQAWQTLAQAGYHPHRAVFAIPADAALPESLAGKASPATGGAAYCCRGLQCLPPITTETEWQAHLAARRNTATQP